MSKPANPIRLYRGGVAGAAPSSKQMQWGQVAINYADRCIYIKDVDGEVVKVASTESVLQALKSVTEVNGKLPEEGGKVTVLPQDIGDHGVPALTDEGKVGKTFLPNFALTVNDVAADDEGNIEIDLSDFNVPTLDDDGLVDVKFLRNYLLAVNGKAAEAEGQLTLLPEDIGEHGVPELADDGLIDRQFLLNYLLKVNSKVGDEDGQLTLLPEDIGEHGVPFLGEDELIDKQFLLNYLLKVNGKVGDDDGQLTLLPEDIGEYGVPELDEDGLVDEKFLLNYLLSVNGKAGGEDGQLTLLPEDIGEYGVPFLDEDGLIDSQFLGPDAVGLHYLGEWDAETNSPELPDPEEVGDAYYLVTNAGTHSGTVFSKGSWIVSNGVSWGPANLISSVAGKYGEVILVAADISDGVFDPDRLGTGGGNTKVLTTDDEGRPVWEERSAFGTVSSVGLEAPVEFEVSEEPITESGNLTLTWASSEPSTFFAGPEQGQDPGVPAFRALADTDLPRIDEGEY